MINWILKLILGSKNTRELRRMQPTVRRINELEQQYTSLSDDELRAKTDAWKAELSQIHDTAALQVRPPRSVIGKVRVASETKSTS